MGIFQIFHNAWVELKFGFSFYDFPWQWKLFIIGCVAWSCLAFLVLEVFKYLVKTSKHRKPVPLNSKWGNPDQYDILWYAGIRKNRSDANEYSHTIYSNTRSRTLKKNKERHKAFLAERKAEADRVQEWKKEQKRKAIEASRKKRKSVGDGFSVAESEKKKLVGTLTEEEKEVVMKMREEKVRIAS